VTIVDHTTGLDRPTRDPGLELHPSGDGEPFAVTVFHPATERYLGLGAAPYRLLTLCDGTRTEDALCAAFGLPPAAPQVVGALAMLRRNGLLLGDGGPAEPASEVEAPFRLRRRLGPFDVMVRTWANPRVAVVEPERFFARMRPALERILAPVPIAAAAVALVAACAFVAMNVRVLAPTIPHGMFSREMLIAGTITWAFLACHEVCHAAVLARFGGRVRRMGVMLFYGRPAMFVDANDAYVLPSRWQRVAVASAGPAFHLVAAVVLAAAVTASQLVDGRASAVERVAFELVVANLVMAFFNLLPFVKLDGYWMLSSALRRPNLRPDAMGQASRLVGRRLPSRCRPAWRTATLMAFGVLSAVSGGLLFAVAFVGMRGWLLRHGRAGAAVVLVLTALLVVAAVHRCRDAVAFVRTSPDGARVAVRVLALVVLGWAAMHLLGWRTMSSVADFLVRTPVELLWR
jgi:putative peptide zinc metalloprotease protein